MHEGGDRSGGGRWTLLNVAANDAAQWRWDGQTFDQNKLIIEERNVECVENETKDLGNKRSKQNQETSVTFQLSAATVRRIIYAAIII